MRGNEGKLIDKIHRQTIKYKDGVIPAIYHQKMNMAPGSPAGTPDVYYEAKPFALWVEYKYIPTWSGKRTIPVNKLTANQVGWLKRAVSNECPCAVIIGDETGACCILHNNEIFNPPAISNLNLYSPKETAAWIAKQTLGPNYKEI